MLVNIWILLSLAYGASGHGRLMEPPSRSSMWRMGFNTPKNYNDNQLYCGGFTYQWKKMQGKCGICGDPYEGRRDNEAGGMYATGQISKTYRMGQVIEAKVDITANHRGYFLFKLCPNNNPQKKVTQECLDRYPLMAVEQGAYMYNLPSSKNKMYKVKLHLPQGLTCTQCVLQWVYTAGNNWGVCEDGSGKTGCGPQEQFRGCADIAITADGSKVHSNNVETGYNNGKPQPIRPSITTEHNHGYGNKPQVNKKYPTNNGIHEHSKTPIHKHNNGDGSHGLQDKNDYDHKYTNIPNRDMDLGGSPLTTEKNWPTKTVYDGNYGIRPGGIQRPKTPYQPYNPNYNRRPTYTRKPYIPAKVYTTRKPIYKKPARRPIINSRPVYGKPKPSKKSCRAVGVWKSVPGMDVWCVNNCRGGYCPKSHCKC